MLGETWYMKKIDKKTVILLYIIIFYAIWTCFELFVKDSIDSVISNEVLCQLVKSGIIKNIVWTIPAIMLVKYYENDVNISLKEMFNPRSNWIKYLPLFALFTVYLLVGAVVTNGKIAITDAFGIDKIIIVLFVGLTEEMVFRGWLLNATIEGDKKWKGIIINAMMFLVIHFPVWIHNGVFISNFTTLSFLSVPVLSVIFSWTFIKSRNILIPIVLHMYWDLLMFMLY